MGNKGKKAAPERNVTPADKAAAARLRPLWEDFKRSFPKGEMSQQILADRWPGGGATQGLISQYLRGDLALNYKAVLFFATQLNVPTSAIRTDLPEQILNRSSTESGGEKNSPRDVAPVSHPAGISRPILDQALEQFFHDEEQAGKYPSHLARVDRVLELYRRIEADGGQLTSAALSRIGDEIDQRRGKDERSGKQGSKFHRRGK